MTHDPAHFFYNALEKLLPNAIERAAQSYQRFSQQPCDCDPKPFAAYHGACKAALGHLSALGKLTQFVEKNRGTVPAPDDLDALLRQARTLLADTAHDKTENQL